MTLVVAKKLKDNKFIIVGDTKLTYDPDYKDYKNSINNANPKYGVIKTVIINSQLCISEAGDTLVAEEAMREIGDGHISKKEVLDILMKYHLESDHEAEFIACFGNPHFEMYSFKNGKRELVQNAWIGSYDGFNKFQYYKNNTEEARKVKLGNVLSILSMIPMPDYFRSNERDVYSSMLLGLDAVIAIPDIEEVGGFAMPIIYQANSFAYQPYVQNYRQPLNIEKEVPEIGKWTTIGFGDAHDGGYSINLASSRKAQVAIYFVQGNLGIIYNRENLGLLYPTFYPNMDEIDFFKEVEKNEDLTFAVSLRHNPGNYFLNGVNKFYAKKYDEAIKMIDQGVKVFSKTWGGKAGEEYMSLGSFYEKTGTKVNFSRFKLEQVNNLKKAFNIRGLAYKELGSFNEALFNFNQSLEIDTNYSDGLLNKAECLYRTGLYEDGVKVMTQGIDLNLEPKHLFYHNRGLMYLSFNNLEQAESDFKNALLANKDYYESFRGIMEINRRRELQSRS